MKNLVEHNGTNFNELSKAESEYYSRQIVLTSLGYNVQLKLKRSKVCLVGVGGLGSTAAMQLAAMGVGFIRIIDRDIVEQTNLHRQHLYNIDDIGYPKVEIATKRLRKLNPYIKIEAIPLSVNENNAKDIVRDMDVVIDGLDSMNARYAINRACIDLQIPYVFGDAVATTGNLSTIIPKKTPCLECFYGYLDDKKLPKCGVIGVHPSLVNVIASLEVSETIRLLIGKKPRLANRLLYFDLDEIEFNEIILSRIDSCPICGSNSKRLPKVLDLNLVEEICGRKGKKVFIITPLEKVELKLKDLEKYFLNKNFKLKNKSKLGLTVISNDVRISILKSSIVIIEGIKEKKEALDFFNEIKKFE